MKVATLDDIIKAYGLIQKRIRKTDFRFSQSCSDRAGVDVFLKFENLQKTGSFKIRGAMNKFLHLSEEEKSRGVIASSAGNHAQGVSYAAKSLGIPSKIVMPVNAPIVKVLATQAYGAEIVLHGNIYDEAFEHAQKLVEEHHYTFIPPYADPYIIAGQGTVALEIDQEIQGGLDAIIVPVGGGGLISGIALYYKAKYPHVKIIGVQSENVSNLQKSFDNKSITYVDPKQSTIADGIAVKRPNEYILKNYLLPFVDEMVCVSESELAEAMVFLLERAKSVVEASAAVSLAALFKYQSKWGKKVCAVLSGGNVDLNILSKVIDQGLSQRGRLVNLAVYIEDKPGSLSELTKIIASHKANIIEVYHDRLASGLNLNETIIEFVLETKSHKHIEAIKNDMVAYGARFKNF